MALGEVGLPVHPLLREALADAAGSNAYGPIAGLPALRAAAAGYWSRRGMPTAPGQVLVGPGSKALLFALRLAIGGDVVLPRPSWVSYAAQASILGGRSWPVAIRPGEGGVPDPAALARTVALARAAGHEVRQILVTLPDNPTGTYASAETIRELCQVAREQDLVIVSDEIYRDLVHVPGAHLPSPAEYAPERTIVTTGLSKSHALGGWRLGVARFPDSCTGRRLRDRIIGIGSEIWSAPVHPVQHAAVLAFDEPRELVAHVQQCNVLHASVANAVADICAGHGVLPHRPAAAFYVYADFGTHRRRLERDAGITSGEALAHTLTAGHGCGVLPGAVFGDRASALRVRLATSLLYGVDDEQRQAALESEKPTELAWISAALEQWDAALAATTATRRPPDPKALQSGASAEPAAGGVKGAGGR
ncbi:pyridoxal phosphate-dependent aminotransferase [Streptodolium elevatio]|uniref:Aminotransferase n=1 Tax=Streptodolium elevatio TaxID=3157996 RepID=A0ABV3D9R9_9ACTN